MSMARRLRPLYLRTRAAVRAAVTRYPAVDRVLGRRLVQIDVLLRRAGLVSVVDADVRTLTFGGARFRFDADNRDLAETVISTGTYEPATLDVIRGLAPGEVFVDLGANVGLFSVLAAQAVGDTGTVHAFEPTPATAALLRHNAEDNGVAGRIRIVERAVSERPGTAHFAVFAGSAQGNQIAPAGGVGAAGVVTQTIEVPVTSLDAYFAAEGWPRVDLIKMDIEGAELPALRGMRGVVERSPGVRLIFEYHLEQLRRADIPGATLLDAVRALGFDRFEVLFRERIPIDLPAEMARLERIAQRANVNVLAWRSPRGS